MQLTEKLYCYPWQGRANNCNSYLLKGARTVLFDPGHIYNDLRENCLDNLISRMKDDGIKVEEIDLILCTHGHPDHVEAAGLFRDRSGARFGIHRGDDFILEAITRHYASAMGKEMPSLQADYYLEEGALPGDEEAAEGEKIEVVESPGHSPGCVCFYLPGEKALVSGDTIFEGSVGRTDLPGGDMATLGRSVDKLSELEGVEVLLPGHMGYVTGASSVKRNFEQIKRFFFS